MPKSPDSAFVELLVPPSTLMEAKRQYQGELNRLASDRETFQEVDDFKEELRSHARKNGIVNLSSGAREHLAGFALFTDCIPADPAVKKIAEEILAYWKEEWGVEVSLNGPVRSNHQLINHKDGFGKSLGGWLDLTARDAGRPSCTGKNRLSVTALICAIEVLSSCWHRSMNGSKDAFRPSAAARFFHQHIVSFEPLAEVEDINYALISRARRFKQLNPSEIKPSIGGIVLP